MDSQTIDHGRFSFNVSYRHLRGDEGLAIVVNGPVHGESRELLRYDCFRDSPHYHTAVHDHNTIKPIDHDDPVAWSLRALASGFADLIRLAGGDSLNEDERSRLRTALSELEIASKAVLDAAKSQ